MEFIEIIKSWFKPPMSPEEEMKYLEDEAGRLEKRAGLQERIYKAQERIVKAKGKNVKTGFRITPGKIAIGLLLIVVITLFIVSKGC